MELEAALERPGRVLGTPIVVENEDEVVGALPSDCLFERIRGQLLGHAPGHQPVHDLPAERVDLGCEAGPSFSRPDVGDVAHSWPVAGFDVERLIVEARARVFIDCEAGVWGCGRLPECGWYGLRVAGRRIMMDTTNLLIPLLCYANGAGGI